MGPGPDYIQFYPTLRCNRACDFCFNRALQPMDDMSLAVFRVMLERLQVWGAKTIDIIGGEPTLHPALVSLIRAAGEAGYEVNLSSNGTNIAVLERILETAKNARIGISVNDQQTLQAVGPFVRSAGAAVKTILSPQLDPCLVDDIIALSPKRFFLIYRDAIGQADIGETLPFLAFMNHALVRSRQAGVVYCSGFLPESENYPELVSVRCPAGTTKLGIMSDGSVYPCNLFFGRPEFMLGNIITDSFGQIWHHPALAFFRRYAGNRCLLKDCEFHVHCHGGCPAQSLLLSGDLAAPDPRCNGARLR